MEPAAESDTAADRQCMEALVAAARDFGERGWTPATGGNYSARLDDGTIMITRSGVDKRRLAVADLMRLSARGEALEDARPSAEAALHVQVYQTRPAVRAVIHVHSPAATVISRRAGPGGSVVLENYELLKALDGIETHAARVELPVVANDQDMLRLADSVRPWLEHSDGPPGYLIAGHGIYCWGETVTDAARHVEALEFILNCEMLEHQ